jgi:hypothetical protein
MQPQKNLFGLRFVDSKESDLLYIISQSSTLVGSMPKN